MLLLTSTSDIIRVVTGTTVAALDVHVSYVDNNAGTITPGRTNTEITTAGTTTIVASPASGVQRNVKMIDLGSTDPTTSTTVTVQHFDGTVSVDLFGVTLLPGENLVLDATGSWHHHDTQGADYAYTAPPGGNNGPTGTIAQTCDRALANTATSGGTSGTLYLSSIYLVAGQLVSNISITASTAFTTPTNQFFALYSGLQTAPALLAQSANQTTTAWAINTTKTLAMTTPYRVTTSGIYYIGVMVTATTMGAWFGPPANGSSLAGQAPVLFAASTPSLTTALPNPANSIAAGLSAAARFYASVS